MTASGPKGVRTIVLALASLALAAAPASAGPPTLTTPRGASEMTCEISGAYRHCFDHHGYESTEQQSPGGYTHGWDSTGHRWTTWEHNGTTTTWPTR
jgi:hypothetical protein